MTDNVIAHEWDLVMQRVCDWIFSKRHTRSDKKKSVCWWSYDIAQFQTLCLKVRWKHTRESRENSFS